MRSSAKWPSKPDSTGSSSTLENKRHTKRKPPTLKYLCFYLRTAKCLYGRIPSICTSKSINFQAGPNSSLKCGGSINPPVLTILWPMEWLICPKSQALQKFSVKCGHLMAIGSLAHCPIILNQLPDWTTWTFCRRISKKERSFSVNRLEKYSLKSKPSEKTFLPFKFPNDPFHISSFLHFFFIYQKIKKHQRQMFESV